MALILKIEGFGVSIRDNVNNKDLFRAIRREAFFSESEGRFSFYDRGEAKQEFNFSELINDETGLPFSSIQDLISFLSLQLGTDESTQPTPTAYSLSRVETIVKSGPTPVEYFSSAQNGTEINPQLDTKGGDYLVILTVLASNSSTNGSFVISLSIDGNNFYVDDFVQEPQDGNNRISVTAQKPVSFTEGIHNFELNLTQIGSGTASIYEASLTLIRIIT